MSSESDSKTNVSFTEEDSNCSTGEIDYCTYNGVYEPYEDEPLAEPGQSNTTNINNKSIGKELANEETDIDGLTASVLEERYEKIAAVDSW
jgi:hypothetical protein